MDNNRGLPLFSRRSLKYLYRYIEMVLGREINDVLWLVADDFLGVMLENYG
jgi:hypothetical protein